MEEIDSLFCNYNMKTEIIYICTKRKIRIETCNYCDWFEKKRSNLKRHNCNNCKFLEYEKDRPKNSEKDSGSKGKKKKTKKKKE